MAEPFLRWVGGKRQLIPELLKHIPVRTDGLPCAGTYFESFVGGGALFFRLQELASVLGRPVKARLNDANPHLINLYMQVRDNVEGVIEALKVQDDRLADVGELPPVYAVLRQEFNAVNAKIGIGLVQAARFSAMNAWGFNGLCRFNKKGGFNVPVGKFSKTPVLMDKADNLRAVSKALAGVELTCGDFEAAVAGTGSGDLVYFDPPYIPATATANFTGYTADGFGDAEQVRLRDLAKVLTARGAHVILSNSDTPRTRALYAPALVQPSFDLHEVQARRAVNSDATKRGKVGELIIVGKG